jgi:hypothetical protein
LLWVAACSDPQCRSNEKRHRRSLLAQRAEFQSSNGPNATEELSYIGDMNCNGTVEKPSTWEY